MTYSSPCWGKGSFVYLSLKEQRHKLIKKEKNKGINYPWRNHFFWHLTHVLVCIFGVHPSIILKMEKTAKYWSEVSSPVIGPDHFDGHHPDIHQGRDNSCKYFCYNFHGQNLVVWMIPFVFFKKTTLKKIPCTFSVTMELEYRAFFCFILNKCF